MRQELEARKSKLILFPVNLRLFPTLESLPDGYMLHACVTVRATKKLEKIVFIFSRLYSKVIIIASERHLPMESPPISKKRMRSSTHYRIP